MSEESCDSGTCEETCDRCQGTGKVTVEPTKVITVRLPKSLHQQIDDKSNEEKISMNKWCIGAFRAALTTCLLFFLATISFGQIQIQLEEVISPYVPNEVGCSCNVTEDEEIQVTYFITSDKPDKPAQLRAHPEPRKSYIWGHPGYHTLIANVAIIQYEIYKIVDSDGVEREVKSVKNLRFEAAQRRFQIEGRVPDENKPPVANAGSDQKAKPGETIQLDGTNSSDPDGDELSFNWSLNKPSSSTASLSNDQSPKPTFVADVAGEYVANLVVDDGFVNDSDSIKVLASAIPEGPRWVIWMEESADRTPAQAATQVAIRRNSTAENSTFWIADADRPTEWAVSYNRYRVAAGQALPCLFVVDQATKEVLHLGDAPKDVAEYDRVVKEHGG